MSPPPIGSQLKHTSGTEPFECSGLQELRSSEPLLVPERGRVSDFDTLPNVPYI